MAIRTHLDELIEYPDNVISALAASPIVVGLILDKPQPAMDGTDDETARLQMFDFDYVPETNLEAKAYICVDADMVASPTGTINDMELYVQIIINKSYMELSDKTWKGRKGNRRDNLAREIDLLLNGSRDYGIGRLDLVSCRTANVPAAFSSKLLTYRIPDFARDRGVGIQ